MSTSQSNGSAIATFAVIALVGGIIGLTASITMPAFKCEQAEFTWADFASRDEMRALELCTDFGGELTPSSGLWVGALGGLVFFGAGGAAWYTARRGSQPSRPSVGVEGARIRKPDPPQPSHPPRPAVDDPVPETPRQGQIQPSDPAQTIPARASQSEVTASPSPTPFTVRSAAERLEKARPASFGNRVPAFLIDIVIMAVLAFVVIAIVQQPFAQEQREGDSLGAVYLSIMAVTFIGYEWILGLTGRTLGMRALGMRIVRVDGAAIDGKSAFVRAIIFFLSSLILVGPFSGLWHKEGRAWHDLTSGTGVIRLGD